MLPELEMYLNGIHQDEKNLDRSAQNRLNAISNIGFKLKIWKKEKKNWKFNT